MPRRIATTFMLLFLLCLFHAAPAAAQRFKTDKYDIDVETVASGLVNPWGLAFLPDRRMLVTERAGRMRIIDRQGRLSAPLSGVTGVTPQGQGGLLGLALDPAFTANRTLYYCHAEAAGSGLVTSVTKARLNAAETGLEGAEIIFRQQPSGRDGRHFGCRIVVDRSGALFIALGDRGDMSASAQDGATTVGKIVRIAPDGAPGRGNPLKQGWKPEIWSIGHRNVQGAALHPATGKLWTAEHGSRGGDEINVPEAGRNYGWPVITYGRDYSGLKIGEGTHKAGMEQPIYYWDPSIAPSGLSFYTGDKFPAWRNSIFVGALAGQLLARLETDGEKIIYEERLLKQLGDRIRDVKEGPDGYLYLLTDEDRGRLLRIKPAQ